MNKKSPILLYGRSPLNIIISLTAIILIIGSTLFFKGIFKLIVSVIVFLIYIIATGIILFTRQGAKEIAGEMEEDRFKKVSQIITRYREMRDRIAFIRIGDAEIAKSLEYFLLISGNYLNKCRELNSYSPIANSKIEEVLEVCQIYLEEYDEQLIEKQYKVKDKDYFNQYKERAVKAIHDASDAIKEQMQKDFSGLTQKEKMEVIEEMNSE
jgi:hypothetical protein